MIEGNILVPISASAYKNDNASFFGAMELDVENNNVKWSFDAINEGFKRAELNDTGKYLKHTGFRPASVQRLNNNNTLISGYKRVIIVDENGELTESITHPRFNDVHEAKLTNNNTILVASTGIDEILEFNDNRKVIWRWKMWEHVDDTPDNYYPSAFGDDENIKDMAMSPDDRFHLNHAQYINEDLILASALNHGTFIIDKETDEILVEITDLDECHNPYWLEDSSIVIAESGNDRIVKVQPTGKFEVMFEGGMEFVKDADKINDDSWVIADTKNSRVLFWKEQEDEPQTVINLPEKTMPYEVDYLTGDEKNA